MSIELVNEAGKKKKIGFWFFVFVPINLIKYRCFVELFVYPIVSMLILGMSEKWGIFLGSVLFFWYICLRNCTEKMVNELGFIGKSEKDRAILRKYGYYSGAEFLPVNERLDYVKEHKEAKNLINTVINGDYCNQEIFYRENSVWISRKSGNILLDTDTVEKYEAIGNTSLESAANAIARGFVDASLKGELGGNVIAIKFKDGKRSVLKLDNKAFQKLVSQCL